MPSDAFLKGMNTIHRVMLKVTGGRFGWTAGNMPVLELTTVGRKSGQKRSVMLTAPVQDGDTYLLVASKGGEDSHPAWFLNLRDDPSVEVSVKDSAPLAMTARILSDDERDELWPQVVEANERYGQYQAKTERKIPLVMLEPAD